MPMLVVTQAILMATEVARLRTKLEYIAGGADNAALYIKHVEHMTGGTISELAVLEIAIHRASGRGVTDVDEILRMPKVKTAKQIYDWLMWATGAFAVSLLPHLALHMVCEFTGWKLPGWLCTLFLIQLGCLAAAALAGALVALVKLIKGEICQC